MIEAKNEELEKDFCGADDVAPIHSDIVHVHYYFHSNKIKGT